MNPDSYHDMLAAVQSFHDGFGLLAHGDDAAGPGGGAASGRWRRSPQSWWRR